MNNESYADLHRKYINPTTIDDREKAVLVLGDGVWVWDESGKKYFDACSQVSCANLGHNHPKFIALMKKYVQYAEEKKIITTVMGTDFFYRNTIGIGNKHDHYPDNDELEISPVALGLKLAPHLFGLENTVFNFFSTGAEAVDGAIRIPRKVSEKRYYIAFKKGFHGRLGESRDVSSSNPEHWLEGGRSGDVFFLPYPETREDFKHALEELNDIPLKHCSCFIYEAIQGEGGGMRVGWHLRDLEEILRKEGLLSIADEIQAGLGRSGNWWAYQQLGLNPDIVVMGKSFGGGWPAVSAVGFKREKVDPADVPPGTVSGTFSASPLGIAAANFVMKIYEEENIIEKAKNLSPLFDKLLRDAIESDDPVYRRHRLLPRSADRGKKSKLLD